MSARVIVHPATWSRPDRLEELTEYLTDRGYVNLCVGPPDHRGRRDLCRVLELREAGVIHLERMDGTQFLHNPVPPRGAA